MQILDLQNVRAREWALKALATLGLIAILALGAWGIARVAVSIPSLLSKIGAAAVSLSSIFIPSERLEVEIPGTVPSGEIFSISWEHINKRNQGSYTVSFACRDALTLEAEAPGGTFQKVFCETPFNLTNAENSMQLRAQTGVRMREVPFTVSFTRHSDGAVTASSDATTIFTNENAPASPATSTPEQPGTQTRKPGTESRSTYTVTTAGRASDPFGKPDLTVRIVALGVLNPLTNAFTAAQSVRAGERAAVRFEVENAGTKTAEYWSFNVVLPTSPFHIFHSDSQPALGPGDKIQYTLGFDQIDTRATGGVITINVDPTHSLFESSENNNITKGTYIVLYQ